MSPESAESPAPESPLSPDEMGTAEHSVGLGIARSRLHSSAHSSSDRTRSAPASCRYAAALMVVVSVVGSADAESVGTTLGEGMHPDLEGPRQVAHSESAGDVRRT